MYVFDMHQFNGNKRYNDYSSFLRQIFTGRTQKISIHAGFTCPNRDGSKGLRGCSYCNNQSFSPDYKNTDLSITQQIHDGISFFSKKYPAQKYLAYFQSYSNTYDNVHALQDMYREALAHPEVVGIVIGTRPDCINAEIIRMLDDLTSNAFVALELGIESTLDRTLTSINRCHSYQETQDAFTLARNTGIHLGGHLIIGLPGESKKEMLAHATTLSQLPIHSLKIHQLQIIKNTLMAHQYHSDPHTFQLFQADAYIDFICEFLTRLRPDIILDRFISESPPDMLIAPQWNGLKNFEIIARIDKALTEKNIWQGSHHKV